MKAIVQTGYGSADVLGLREIEKPVVKDDDVLVRVHASSVNAGDYFTMKGSPWMIRFSVGIPKPKGHILGWDVAGRVEAVGKNVSLFRPGDEVFGACQNTFAEYASAPAGRFAVKPTNLTFEQAAAVPSAACTALQGLRDVGKLRPDMKVLVNGASGGVGSFAVQVAKAMGAEVTGVSGTNNTDLVRSLGADRVVDYTRQDFSRDGRRYDLILDNVGNRSFRDLRRALAPGGVIVPNTGHGGMGYVFKAFALSAFSGGVKRPFLCVPRHSDLAHLKELIESGKIKPVIDRTFSLADVPKALAYAAGGHVRGKVVITVG
jgi:NADPH:quinone reductase-like Zn-dependent oxidoreductase